MAGIQQAFNQTLALFAAGGQMSRQTKALEASTPEAVAERAAQAAEKKYDILTSQRQESEKPYAKMSEGELRGGLELDKQALGYLTEAYEANPTEKRAETIQNLTETKHEAIKDAEQELVRREKKREENLRAQKEAMEIRKQILSGTPYDFMRKPEGGKL